MTPKLSGALDLLDDKPKKLVRLQVRVKVNTGRKRWLSSEPMARAQAESEAHAYAAVGYETRVVPR